MKANTQRIWAVVGLVLIIASVVLMLTGLFAGAAKALLLNIALFCFVGAVGILLALSMMRSKAAEDASSRQDAE